MSAAWDRRPSVGAARSQSARRLSGSTRASARPRGGGVATGSRDPGRKRAGSEPESSGRGAAGSRESADGSPRCPAARRRSRCEPAATRAASQRSTRRSHTSRPDAAGRPESSSSVLSSVDEAAPSDWMEGQDVDPAARPGRSDLDLLRNLPPETLEPSPHVARHQGVGGIALAATVGEIRWTQGDLGSGTQRFDDSVGFIETHQVGPARLEPTHCRLARASQDGQLGLTPAQ